MRQSLDRALPLAWLILVTWGVWRIEPFYRVGMASQDQVNFSLQATGAFWHEVLGHAQAQGRVYFLFTKIVDLWLAARPEVGRVHIINLLVFGLSAPCFAYAVFRCRAQRLLYVWLFASLAWASYHHLPPAAYPTVNHLPFLLWALAAYLVRRTSARAGERSGGTVVAFGVLAFGALFQYEPVAAMSLCLFGWLAYGAAPALRKRLGIALGSAALSYLAVYVGWRLRFPTSYDGAMAGTVSLWNVLRVTVAYAVGGLPFCEAYSDSLPLRFGDRHVGETLLRWPGAALPAPSALAVLLTLLALAGLWLVYERGRTASAPEPRRLRIGLWVLPVLFLLAVNGLLGLSAKYQQWVRDWDETYLTSQLALYPLVLFATLVLGAAHRYLRVRGVPVAFGALALGIATLSLPVYAHNRSLTSLQRANLARWEEVTALASYASHIEQPYIVAPDLYYSVFIGERDWTNYWGQYVHWRFGGWLSFLARPPQGRADFARVLPYRFEDGRLRAISVQTPDYIAIVARPENAPRALLVAGGRAVPLDWSDAELLGRSGYSAVTLSEPAELLGTSRQIEPVWLWPEAALAPSP